MVQEGMVQEGMVQEGIMIQEVMMVQEKIQLFDLGALGDSAGSL